MVVVRSSEQVLALTSPYRQVGVVDNTDSARGVSNGLVTDGEQ